MKEREPSSPYQKQKPLLTCLILHPMQAQYVTGVIFITVNYFQQLSKVADIVNACIRTQESCMLRGYTTVIVKVGADESSSSVSGDIGGSFSL